MAIATTLFLLVAFSTELLRKFLGEPYDEKACLLNYRWSGFLKLWNDGRLDDTHQPGYQEGFDLRWAVRGSVSRVPIHLNKLDHFYLSKNLLYHPYSINSLLPFCRWCSLTWSFHFFCKLVEGAYRMLKSFSNLQALQWAFTASLSAIVSLLFELLKLVKAVPLSRGYF